MKNLFKVSILALLLSACASTGPVEPSNGCVVKTGDGIFNDTVSPGLKQARLESKNCLLGFWLCRAMEASIDSENKITVTYDRVLSSSQQPYGTVTGDKIVRHVFDSGMKGVLTKLASSIAEEQGPIVIDRKNLRVQYPTVAGKVVDISGGEKSYMFTPQCTNEQAALGAAVIEYKRNL